MARSRRYSSRSHHGVEAVKSGRVGRELRIHDGHRGLHVVVVDAQLLFGAAQHGDGRDLRAGAVEGGDGPDVGSLFHVHAVALIVLGAQGVGNADARGLGEVHGRAAADADQEVSVCMAGADLFDEGVHVAGTGFRLRGVENEFFLLVEDAREGRLVLKGAVDNEKRFGAAFGDHRKKFTDPVAGEDDFLGDFSPPPGREFCETLNIQRCDTCHPSFLRKISAVLRASAQDAGRLPGCRSRWCRGRWGRSGGCSLAPARGASPGFRLFPAGSAPI